MPAHRLHSSIRGDKAAPYVWTVSDDHIRRVPLTVGKDFGDQVQVTTGLTGAETVVVGTPPPLREGQAVQVAGGQ